MSSTSMKAANGALRERDPARLRDFDFAAERLREVTQYVREGLVDQLAIDLLRHDHVLVVRIRADTEANDLRQPEDVKAIDEQRMSDSEEQLIDRNGVHGHKS